MLDEAGDEPQRVLGRDRTLAEHTRLGAGEVEHGRRRSGQRARVDDRVDRRL